MTGKVVAVTVATAEASEAWGAVLQTKEVKTAATEVAEEIEIVATVDPPPRAASVPALCTLAEKGRGQVVVDSQRSCRRPFQCQVIYKCPVSY